MTRRESILHTLGGGSSGRIPRAVYGGGRWACRQAGLTFEDLVRNPSGYGSAFADVYGRLDTDIVFAGSGFNTVPAEAPDRKPLRKPRSKRAKLSAKKLGELRKWVKEMQSGKAAKVVVSD